MNANVAVRVAIALAILAALVLPVYSLIQLDGNTFVLGEDVNVGFIPSPGLRLDIVKDDTVFSYLGNQSSFAFTPSTAGFYEIQLVNITHDSIKEQTGFAVVSSQILNVFTDKKSYLLGEPVFIYADLGFLNQSYNMTISTEQEIFFFLGEIKNPLQFIPRSVGNYEVNLFGQSGKSSSNFSVESYNPFKARRSSFKITSAQKSYYLGDTVGLKLTFPQNETLEFYIKSGENVYRFFGIPQGELTFIPKEPGEYEASIEQAGNLLASYKFSILQKPALSQDELSQFLNYSFNATGDAIIEIDFAQKTGVVRNILEASLRTTLIEQVTAYIEGHHNDERFELSIEHIEYDRFRVTVKSNPKIPPGVYRLIAAGKYSKKTYRFEVLFNWGVSDRITFNEQIEKLRKTKQNPIETQKQSYSKEDIVFVDSNISAVDIVFDNFTFRFTSDMQHFAYLPPKEGNYEIKAQESSDAAIFHVLAAQDLPVQQKAEPGKKVRWKKTLRVKNEEAPWALVQSIIPGLAQNISVASQGEPIDIQTTGFYGDSLLYFFNDLMPFEEKQYEIEYETPATSKSETEIKNSKVQEKEITLASAMNYENVLSYSDIEEMDAHQVRLLWLVNGTEIDVMNNPMFNATLTDTNSNGAIDRISWLANISPEQKFRVRVVKSVDIALGVKDSFGNTVAADFEIYTDDALAGTDFDLLSRSLNLSKKNDIVIYPKNKAIKKVEVQDIRQYSDSQLAMGIDDVPASKDKSRSWNRIYAINPGMNFSNATVTARAQGKELFKCRDWDFETQSCMGQWQYVMDLVPGEDYTITITPDDPGFGETNITIINVQSYPTVGGLWEVRFNTTGTADLIITASNLTTWSNNNDLNDLRFLEVRCGSTVMNYTWQNNGPLNSSVIVYNYNCGETGTEVSRVLTTGKHTIRFSFGDAVTYANNFASYFIDNTDEDFNGTRFRVNVSGSGITANVTLNYTTISTLKVYNTSGNYTSRIFDSGSNYSVFDAIAWEKITLNSTDVMGYAFDTTAGDIGVFYRNGSYATDQTQADLASAIAFSTALRRYTIPTDVSYNDILGFGVDDNSDDIFAFLVNGSTISDTTQTDFTTDIAFTSGLGAWSIPANFNKSDIIGFTINSGLNNASVFFKNGSYVVANQETPPFTFSEVRSYTLPPGFSSSEVIGVEYHTTADDIAMFFRNGSFVSNTSIANFNTSINFISVFSASYLTGLNLTTHTNITLHTRISNDSVTFSQWDGPYTESGGSSALSRNKGRFIQYKAVFKTPDWFMTPVLENVSINYTLDATAPVILSISPSNNSFLTSPVNLAVTTDDAATCKYNNSNSTFNYSTSGTSFTTTGGVSHSSSISLGEGAYTYYVKCTDPSNNTNDDSTQASTTFFIDQTKPGINLTSPFADENSSLGTINFTWVAFDNLDTNMTCNLSVDGIKAAENITSFANIPAGSVTSVEEGLHTWNVSCVDHGNNINSSETRAFFFKKLKSIVSIQTSADSYKQNRDVFLVSSIRDDRGDQESGTQNAVAREKNYEILFEHFDPPNNWTIVSGDDPTSQCPGGFGLFSNCSNNGPDYLFAATTAGAHISDGHTIVMQDWDTLNFNMGIWEEFNPNTICNGTCRDIAVSGYIAAASLDAATDFCKVWARNLSSSTFHVTVANCTDGETACEFSEDSDGVPFSTSNYKFFNTTLVQNLSLNFRMTNYTAVHIGADLNGLGDQCFYEDINITGIGWERDSNSTPVTYSAIGGQNYTKLSDIDIKITVTYYNASMSANFTNLMPDIEYLVYNGSDYPYKGVCNLTTIYGNSGKFHYNCTDKVSNPQVLAAWANSENRKVQVRGLYLDTTPLLNDSINWTGVFVEIETPSKIENYGNWNISGTLSMQVRNSSDGIVSQVYSQQQSLRFNSTINISNLWNQQPWSTNSYPLGRYYAHVAFLNSSLEPIRNFAGSFMNDSYNFSLDYLKISIQSPLNNSIVDATNFWANVSLSWLSFPSGGYCEYEIDPGKKSPSINSSELANFTESQGNFINTTFSDNSSFWLIGNDNTGSSSYLVNATQEIVFQNDEFLRVENLRNITLTLDYCHTRKSSGGMKCNGTTPTGVSGNGQNVSIFNYSSSKWAGLGTLRNNSDGLILNDVFYPNGTLSDFVNSSSGQIKFRIISNFTNAIGASTFLLIDYARLETKSRVPMLNDSTSHFFNFTKAIEERKHNITFYCNDTSGDVSSSYVFTFNATDQTHPAVRVVAPGNNSEQPNGNITFVFNVTDTVSGITQCIFEFMFADNSTNTTILENVNQSFRVENLDNGGPYTWRIRCRDNSSNSNEGNSSYSSFIVGQDTDAPIITLRDPIDLFNTTNNDVVFSYRVNDITSSISNCSLILNGRINQTNTTISEQGAFPFNFNNFTVFDMPDADYNWSINCTDVSSNANIGASATRRLNVSRDLVPPIITLLDPVPGYTDTDGFITFVYNVSDASSRIANCSLIINRTINMTVQGPQEDIESLFSVGTRFNNGFYNWSVNCTDDSFDLNWNLSLTRNFTVNRLSDLKVSVGTDKSLYEQGTQINETILVSTNTSDQVDNPINATVKTDIIYANTTLRWWNVSWQRRKPIFINETRGQSRLADAVIVNLTSLSGFISSCNEIRIIRNVSLAMTEIEYNILGGDNSDWCSLKFKANISANQSNQNDYYAYYNFSGAQAMNYPKITDVYNLTLIFEQFEGGSWTTISSDDPVTDCTGGFGTNFNNCVDNGDYLFARTTGGTEISPSNALVMEDWDSWTATSGIFFVFNPKVACGSSPCEDVRVTGYMAAGSLDDTVEQCRVWARTANTSSYQAITECLGPDPSCEYTDDNNALPAAASDYHFFNGSLVANFSMDINTNFTAIHIGGQVPGGADHCLYEDVKIEGIKNATFNATAVAGAAQLLVNSSINDTNAFGRFGFGQTTSGLATGIYSAVSFAFSSNYNNASNATQFRVITDATSPEIGMVYPAGGFVSEINSITFIYNVTDTLSGIFNCTLLINGSINQTMTSPPENISLNFTLNNTANGVYNWNVNCTDDSSNRNRGSGTQRSFTIAVDSTPPAVTLLNPQNNYTDTNLNVSFNYSVTDDFTSTADCTLYINGTANTSQENVPTDGSTRTFDNLTFFNNGSFSWYVNCTDDSIARNYNISLSRNFTAIQDLEAPVIILVFPPNPGHVTNPNVTFIFNVTDAISNVSFCSLSINGSLNQTNFTITTGVLQNFTIKNLSGTFNWSINCTDSSENKNKAESEVRNLLVAPDVYPPEIALDFPPDNIELNPGNVSFIFNVTDLASGIRNCTLHINNTLNRTLLAVLEGVPQNMTQNLTDGFYTWHINCTDDSANLNSNRSEKRNLTIGTDRTAPFITLFEPLEPYTDTNGIIFFNYTANDIASPISNCSIIINNTINLTNSTIEKLATENFTIGGFNNGTYLWQINCTDNSSSPNTGNSTSRLFTVILDVENPIVRLADPPNGTIDTDGRRTFFYNVTDTIAAINNCSLIINNKLNLTNTTVAEDTRLNFTLTGLSDGDYNWSVNCTDNSENFNRGASAFRNLSVINDNAAPTITLLGPPDNTTDTNGIVTFNYSVSDAISGISSCTLRVGATTSQDTTITEGILQQFNISGLTTADYYWNISCTDNSENSNSAASSSRNISILIDSTAPVVSLIRPFNNTQELFNNVTFFYNVTDISEIGNCSLIINGTINQSNTTRITKATTLNFTIVDAPNATILWEVNCTDVSEDRFVGSSGEMVVTIGPDITGPTVSLSAPPADIQDTDGNVTFEYNATDLASGLANCSLYINGTLNQTTAKPPEDTKLNFTLNNTAIGVYNWSVSCWDNFTNPNLGVSQTRGFSIGEDTTGPSIDLVSPANNSILNSLDAVLEYTAVDFASNISNCTLVLNGRANVTNYTISELSSNFFRLHSLDDADYSWQVNCTDGSNNSNRGASVARNFTLFRPKQLIADIYTNQSSYEQGSSALVTANISNSSLEPFDSPVYIDIIRGNTTAPFFDSAWMYRIPIDINTTNVTRKDSLIELSINFTKALVSEMGISGKTFDGNSIRVVEWMNNRSVLIPFQFENSSNFNPVSEASGKIFWILNGTTSDSAIRQFFVYFDTTDNGAKAPANLTSYLASYSFSGSQKTVLYDGASQSADFVRISKGTEAVSLQFANGQDIANQQNIDWQGAGALWNITADDTRLSNYYDSIVPVALYNNYFLHLNSTANVSTGPVYTKIRIPGRLNASLGTSAELNYTIWFGSKNIFVRADLSVVFSSANSDPQSLFNNLWFAYLFDYDSDYNSFIRNMNSSSFTQVHRWHLPVVDTDTTNQFNAGDWYSEYAASRGSVNIFLKKFELSGSPSTNGLISYDDWYNPGESKTTESDGVGFNLNSDQTVSGGDSYSLTAYMVLSSNRTSLLASELKSQIDWPMNITIKKAQKLVNRTVNASGPSGVYSFNWSTSNQPAGNYTATVIANKSLYTLGVDFWNFVIIQDTTPPVVGLVTANDTWFSSVNISLVYNVSDSNSIANCSLYVKDRLNLTEYGITNHANNLFKVNNTAEGFYHWMVNCSDSEGNYGNSTTRNFTVDITKPGPINLTGPANNSLFNITTFEFNFTVIDNLDQILNCDFVVDGLINTGVNATNGTLTRKNLTLTQAVHQWYVNCSDNAGNINSSSTRIVTVDSGAPSIALNGPANSSFSNRENITLYYTPFDLSLANCTLIVNGAANQTNYTPESGTINPFGLENRTENRIEWQVNCTDSIGQQGSSDIFVLFFDYTAPQITLNNPSSGYIFNSSSIQLNFTPLDNFDSLLDCNVTINGTVNNSQLLGAANNSVFVYNSSGFTDGYFYWNASCIDSANNSATSSMRNFSVIEAPSIAQIAPANATRNNKIRQNFTYIPRDNSGRIANCTLVLNNKANVTNSSINASIQNNLTVNNLQHNAYNWSVNCTDTSGNTGTNLTPYQLYVDLQGPSITLNTPTQGQAFNTDDIPFNFTPTDQFGFLVNLNCSISLDGSVNVSNIIVPSGSDNVTVIENLSQGPHTYNVTCFDDFNNSNTSATVTFIVNSPDLTINVSDTYFNNTNPNENDSVLVNATIFNIGGISAENFSVLFYDRNFLFENDSIEILPFGSNTTVNATFNATRGFHNITVIIDYGKVELSKLNNNISNNLTVLLSEINKPINNSWTNLLNATINFTLLDFANSTLNYTVYVDNIFNRTANTTDNLSKEIELNLSEGVHRIIVEANGPRVDFQGKNASLFRKKNSTVLYINVDRTAPLSQFETANQSWFRDNTPEIRFNITDNLDSVLNYTLYINKVANQTNYTTNGTSRAVNLSVLDDGTYNLTIEAYDEAGNRANSTALTIYVDTANPIPRINTLNNSNFSDPTPEINFSIADLMAPTINYSFYVDNAIDRNGSALNDINRTDNLTSLADGYHRVILEATDLAGNKANSTFINITVDTTAPVITVENPNEAQPTGYTISLLATVTDALVGTSHVRYSILNDSGIIFQNGTLNASTGFDDIWDSTINITEAFDFMYINFTITANDTLGNSRNFTRRFIVDNKRPSITFAYPDGHDVNRNFNLDIRIVNRNLTRSTYNITNITGNLLQNNSNASIFAAQYNWTHLVNISNLTFIEGYYNISVFAIDDVGNNRTAYALFRVDRTFPNVTLNYPPNNTNFSATTIQFNFTAIDNFDSHLNCNLTIDGVVALSNINATNNTVTNVTYTLGSEGVHFWTVSCEDNAGNLNVSINRTFTIDQGAPRIQLNRPANNSFNSSTSMTFFYTANDTTGISSCTLVLNGVANQTNTTVQNGIENNFTVTTLEQNRYEWTVNCTDMVGNIGTNDSIMVLYIDTTAPNASFITNNGTWFNTASPTIFFNITDNFDQQLNFTVYVDGTSDVISWVANGTTTSRTLSSIPNGTHIVAIESYDNAYNRINSTNLTIIVDTVQSNITLLGPLNNSNLSASDITFFFNVSDNLDEELLCNLSINGIVNLSYFPANSTKNSSRQITGFNTGFYNWSVSCMDNATNTVSSLTFYFNLTPPDLEVSTVDITFNVTEIEEGKNFTIFVNVTNIGRGDARDATVQVFEGDPDAGGFQINGNFSLNLSSSQNKTVNVSWSFGIGASSVFVHVDRGGKIQELNETNNKANRSINVSAYNIISGNLTGSLILGSLNNRTIFSWEVSNSTAGSIFTVDSDSYITWTNLSALSVNISYGNTTTDFEDLDRALNMTNLTDSINRTYSFNGRPKDVLQYVVFAAAINNTPVANSTNNSNFVTGILWDKSDANFGEFNGSQDVVFISSVNRQIESKYGLYDFEIRVPARLRQYRLPNLDNSVTFYVELK